MEKLANVRYVLFDLDGTLTDSYPAITASFLYAIEGYGVTLSDAQLSSIIGPPLKDSFMEILGVDAYEAWDLVIKYREYYNSGGMFNCKVYDGMEETLRSLKDSGKVLAVATSKPEEQAIEVLEHFGLHKYFEVIAGDDQACTRSSKELVIKYCLDKLGNPPVNQVAMVGDRSYDMLGAKRTGALAIGVKYGYGSLEELNEAGADYVVDVKGLKELLND